MIGHLRYGWFFVEISAVLESCGQVAILFGGSQSQIKVCGVMLLRDRLPPDPRQLQAGARCIHPIEHHPEEWVLAQAALRPQIRHQFLEWQVLMIVSFDRSSSYSLQ